jgi:hypothetical protein
LKKLRCGYYKGTTWRVVVHICTYIHTASVFYVSKKFLPTEHSKYLLFT